jgi:hypothetical protein
VAGVITYPRTGRLFMRRSQLSHTAGGRGRVPRRVVGVRLRTPERRPEDRGPKTDPSHPPKTDPSHPPVYNILKTEEAVAA